MSIELTKFVGSVDIDFGVVYNGIVRNHGLIEKTQYFLLGDICGCF